MSEQKPSTMALPRPRVALRLVPPLPHEVPPPPGACALLEEPGLRLTQETLEANGRVYRLRELTGFRTRRKAPRLSLPLLLAGVGVTLAVPLLLARPEAGLLYAALTGGMGLGFATLLYTLVANDTYGLVLRTAEGDHEVFQTQDPKRFTQVVETLDAVLVRRLPMPASPSRTASS